MGLNLTMILSHAPDLTILSSHLDRLHPAVLSYPVLYAGEQKPEKSKLYVARAQDLSPEADLSCHPSMVIFGSPPTVYVENCDYIAVSESTDLFWLFNRLQDIFAQFREYENRIRHLCSLTDHYKQIGDIGFELFGNPVSLYDSHEKLMFFSYDTSRPPYEESYMATMKPGQYMPEDEWRMLHTTHSMTYTTIGPDISSSDYYAARAMYINIRHEGQYLGRLLVDESYHPFVDSDYPMLEWFSSFIYDCLIRNGDLQFGKPRQFNEMMASFILNRAPFHPMYSKILEEVGWDRMDTYICAYLHTRDLTPSNVKTSGDALYLNAFFDSHSIILDDLYIIQIFNLTRSKYTYEQYLRRLSLFLRFNNNVAGISACFHNLSEAWYCAQQARYAMDLAKTGDDTNLITFNECALHMMLSNIRGQYTEDFYCSDSVRKLMAYDIENGTELSKTLRCYLENNMNYSAIQDILHIARTTALYRIRRVEEITGLDLSDLDTRLYLLLLFRLSGS